MINSRLIWTPVVISALLLQPLITKAQISNTNSRRFDAVAEFIRKKLETDKIPSIAVAVAEKGKVVWEAGFGFANLEKRVAATANTIYPIGSVAKPLTATALMQLVQSGDVDLDQPVNKYLGDAKLQVHVGDENAVTVRRLAAHTAGIPRHSTIFYEDETFSPPSIEESIRRYGHIVREPGESYEYSNFNYATLAYLIAQTSKTDFGRYMATKLFAPLGMIHSTIGVDPRLKKFYAFGYTTDRSPTPPNRPNFPGASGIYSSAHDLIRFAMFHQKHLRTGVNNLLDDRHIDEMQNPAASIPGENGFGMANNSYGIGWSISPDRYGYRQIFHTGHDGFSTAVVTMLPEADISVVVLMNGGNSSAVVAVTDEILGTLLPAYKDKMSRPAPRPSGGPDTSYKPAEQYLGQWTGTIETYAGKTPVDVWFQQDGDIHIQMRGQLRTLVNGARFENGYFRGSFAGDIGTDDANRRRPYNLHLKLKPRGDVLNGSVTATTSGGKRAGEVLSYWIELKKK